MKNASMNFGLDLELEEHPHGGIFDNNFSGVRESINSNSTLGR